MIDYTDRQILSILQDNARTSNAEVARRVGMAPSAVYERIRKLEERGVIAGYHARLTGDELDLGLQVFLTVKGPQGAPTAETAGILAGVTEVLEVHQLAGDDALLLKVRVRGLEALAELVRDRIASVPGVRDVRTSMVLQTFKDSAVLPLEADDEDIPLPT